MIGGADQNGQRDKVITTTSAQTIRLGANSVQPRDREAALRQIQDAGSCTGDPNKASEDIEINGADVGSDGGYTDEEPASSGGPDCDFYWVTTYSYWNGSGWTFWYQTWEYLYTGNCYL